MLISYFAYRKFELPPFWGNLYQRLTINQRTKTKLLTNLTRKMYETLLLKALSAISF